MTALAITLQASVAQAAVARLPIARDCNRCGGTVAAGLPLHGIAECNAARKLQRTTARLALGSESIAALLKATPVTISWAHESSAAHVLVTTRLELASDPWRLDAEGRPQGEWVNVDCEYSDPEWDESEPRRLIAFGVESWSLTDAYGNELPMLLSDDEWHVLRAFMDREAEHAIENEREKEINQARWDAGDR